MNDKEDQKIMMSRRSFLKGAALGTAGIAMTGVLGACLRLPMNPLQQKARKMLQL